MTMAFETIKTGELSSFAMAHDFARNTILSRYAFDIDEDTYIATEAYEEVLGASLCHYLAINSPATNVSIITAWGKNEKDEDVRVATIAFDLIGARNNHVGRENVAKHFIDYLVLSKEHAAEPKWSPDEDVKESVPHFDGWAHGGDVA